MLTIQELLAEQLRPLRRETITLAANGYERKPLFARSLFVQSISGSVKLSFNDLEEVTPFVGMAFELPEGFNTDTIAVRETAGAAASIELVYSDGVIKNQATTISGAIQVTDGDTLSTPAPVTAGSTATSLVATTTSDSRTLLIQNLSTSENLYVGDSNVGNDASPRGLLVEPKGALEIRTRAQVYGRRGDATDVSVAIMEIET